MLDIRGGCDGGDRLRGRMPVQTRKKITLSVSIFQARTRRPWAMVALTSGLVRWSLGRYGSGSVSSAGFAGATLLGEASEGAVEAHSDWLTGSVTRKQLPCPGVLRTVRDPPWE